MTNIPKQERAQILTEALPYIQEFYDKVVVIKYGGNAMINEERKQQVMEDIVLLSGRHQSRFGAWRWPGNHRNTGAHGQTD